MATKNTAVAVKASDAILEALRNEFPAEQGFTRVQLPRLGMFSQHVEEEVKDKKTGKKRIDIISEAGTFYVDRQSDEADEDGKKPYQKTDIEGEIDGIIIFQRRQLRHYDEATEEYTSSPIFDFDEDVVTLFKNKKEVGKGTPAELKALQKFQVTKDGKTKSTLEENKILYVLYNDELFQMNLRGSSMYSYKTYSKELGAQDKAPSVVLTHFSSEECEKGDIKWNKMIFTAKRDLSQSECEAVFEKVKELKAGIAEERSFFASKEAKKSEEDEAAEKALNDF